MRAHFVERVLIWDVRLDELRYRVQIQMDVWEV